MVKENVILVDIHDNEIGVMEKIEAHEKGLLHRAFSVFIFNSNGEFLLQRRNSAKYHSGGLLSNTCCSHPRKGEDVKDAAIRRLKEEMGMTAELISPFSFQYKSHLDHNLIENELDHVFIGFSDDVPIPNKDEVEAYCYVSSEVLMIGLEKQPNEYTAWLRICFNELMNYMNKSTIYEKISLKSKA